jgi:hypothetical protein
MNVANITSVAAWGFNGPLSDAPSSKVSVGVVGQRLFEFRNKPSSVWLVRASFVGRPR